MRDNKDHPNLDLSLEQGQISINGFPVYFRPQIFSDGEILYVPRGLSRMPLNKAWRIYFSHKEGTKTDTVYDLNGSLKESLQRAWCQLVDLMESATSTLKLDLRPRTPGVKRMPFMDTGVTGVSIIRSQKDDAKVIEVHSKQSLEGENQARLHRHVTLGRISESRYLSDPNQCQAQFERAIVNAVAVRRYFRHLVSTARRPDALINYSDVPTEFRNELYDLPDIRLGDLFASYVTIFDPEKRTPKESEDDGLKAAALQEMSLLDPVEETELNGFPIQFRKGTIAGIEVNIPKDMHRTADRWCIRIRIRHKDGMLKDDIEDGRFQSHPTESLQEAWAYLISLYRELTPPASSSKRRKDSLIDTGLKDVYFSTSPAPSQKNEQTIWRFTVTYRPKSNSSSIYLGHWN